MTNACQRGITLVELLIATTIAGVLFAGIGSFLYQSLAVYDYTRAKNSLNEEVRFALRRMRTAIVHSKQLLLPMPDNPNTNWPENIRVQTLPASAPVGDSTFASAVLAVALPLYFDLDADGHADADNDRDGRVDEDPPGDLTNDLVSGIIYIDDDGDGQVDEAHTSDGPDEDDDDEDGVANEDGWDGVDEDGDNKVDEDTKKQTTDDDKAGIAGIDDDGDGGVDEGHINDDDEDGSVNEDWVDPLVFYLDNGHLMQRTPVPWDTAGGSTINGADFISSELAENVTLFRVERVAGGRSGEALVDLTLGLTDPTTGETVTVNTRVRLGGQL